ILIYRFEIVVDDECAACQTWERVSGLAHRHITRNNHSRLGNLPQPHRFLSNTEFCPISTMTGEEILHQIERLKKGGNNSNEADMLSLYHRHKFKSEQGAA